MQSVFISILNSLPTVFLPWGSWQVMQVIRFSLSRGSLPEIFSCTTLTGWSLPGWGGWHPMQISFISPFMADGTFPVWHEAQTVCASGITAFESPGQKSNKMEISTAITIPAHTCHLHNIAGTAGETYRKGLIRQACGRMSFHLCGRKENIAAFPEPRT